MPARLRTARLLVAALATVLLLPVAAAQARTRDALDRRLDRIVDARLGPPGVSVLIHRPGSDEFRKRGVADVRTRRRPTRDDHMRIASMAKAFNGAVALSLASKGRMALSDTIAARLPGALPNAGPVTAAQALQHVGGLPDYIRTDAFLEEFTKDPTAYLSPQQLLGFVRDEQLEFPPGSRYHYSDTDNIVVALMAEAATGATYEELLASEVATPLGLTKTSLPRTVAMPTPYLHGYDIEAGKAPEDVSRIINPAGAWASGGIVSTPREVGTFFRAYVGGRLFDAATRQAQRVFRPGSSSPPGPGRNAAALGLFRYTTRCGVVYGHTGSFPGYRLFAAASEDGSRSVVFSVNAQIVPGSGSRAVSDAIRTAQEAAVCRALR